MNADLKIFLSMSLSGSLLILAVLAAERLWRNRISQQWQYYIWIPVICRLLLPFGPETSLLGRPYQALERAVVQTASLPPQSASTAPGDASVPAAIPEQNSEHADAPADALPPAHSLQEVASLLVNHIWVLWLAAALALLIRKITIYQSFMRYIRAGWTPVSDTELLDRLSIAAERSGVQRPVELYVHPLISSPLLAGFFRPCIVLPSTDLPEKDFHYIVLHEMIHCRRGDLLYKWLVQITVCLHWFNPLVHLMGREIARACEFSCDEAVLTETGAGSAQEYGKTLLDAMAAVGRYGEHPGAVTLSENKQLLKERLGAIMSFGESSTAVRLLTGVLTLCVMLGTVFVGVYPAAASDLPSHPPVSESKNSPQTGAETPKSNSYASQAEQYYKSGSLPLFQIAFSRLDEASQREWLEKIYADGDFAFFSVAVNGLGEDSVLLAEMAEKAYAGEEIAFFSTLTDRMDEAELELWLDRALEDGNWAFQSMLFDKLGRYDEYDKWKDENEKKWAEAQAAEYRAAGVTWEGKNCYYQGQLVNIFLDIRPNKSVYTLDLNPAGTVNIKIVRGTDNKITGVAYMTEAEVTALLTDMSDDDDDWQETADGRIWHPQVIPVDCKVVKAGEVVWLGEYTLSEGDRIWYNVLAETGNGMQVGFAASGDARLDTTYYSVENLRQEGESLECTASFTVRPPAGPGTYQLFLRATDGALGNVKGSISIGYIADAS